MDGHGKVGLVEDARMKFHQLSPKLNMLGGEGGGGNPLMAVYAPQGNPWLVYCNAG